MRITLKAQTKETFTREFVERLNEYAEHGEDCRWKLAQNPDAPGACTCGLDAMLAEIWPQEGQ